MMEGADLRRPRAEEGADLRDLSEGAPHGFEPPGGKGGADDQHECLIGFPPKLKEHDFQWVMAEEMTHTPNSLSSCRRTAGDERESLRRTVGQVSRPA